MSDLREGWFEAVLARTGFLRRYPRYAGLLARMDPIATNLVPVMAVCLRRPDDPRSRIQLLVNVAYFARFPQFCVGVLLHEIQHVRLGHLTDPRFHGARHPRLMELAMELSADEPIAELLPANGLEMEHFTRFGVRPGQSTLERYGLLARAYERGELKMQDWWMTRMRDTHRPGRRGAWGSGIGDLLDRGQPGPGGLQRPGRPASSEWLRKMKQRIQEHLGGAAEGAADSVAARPRALELERVVMETGAGAHLDWPRILAQVFRQRRSPQPDYLRPNRRFPDRVGQVPGRRRRPPRPAVLAAVDTSGSMTAGDLDRIAHEVRRLGCHARVTVAESDAAVHRVHAAARVDSLIGGGDTDFAPVFAEANRLPHLDGVIYFTDGKGNSGPVAARPPTLWVLTHDDPFDAPWGSVARLPAAP